MVVVVSITVLVTFFIGGIGIFFYQALAGYEISRFDKSAAGIADQLSAGLTSPIWNLDDEQINNVLQTSLNDEIIQALSVKLYETNNQPYINTNLYSYSREPDTDQSGDILIQYRTISKAGTDLGILTVKATRKYLRIELQNSLLIFILTIIFLDILLICGLFYIFQQTILVPLQAVKKIALGSSLNKKGLVYYGEIGILKESIETMLRELYHRTKNNMQVICSMLDLQSKSANDPYIKSAFMEMQNRIYSMALVHQKLYQSQNLSEINLKDYIKELSELLVRNYQLSDKISLNLDLENIPAVIDSAIPCGLILNELISNSLKYAFPDGGSGLINIELKEKEGYIELKVSDNGKVLPNDFDFRNRETLGMKTIFLLAENQLQGTIEFSSQNGVSCRVRFRSGFSAV
ncbi:MAG: sensor histidine kinase [Brevinematales bacterium]